MDYTDWEYNEAVQEYSKHTDIYGAEVKQDRSGHGATFVSIGAQARFGGYYPTLAEAKAWCDERIAQMRRGDTPLPE